MAYPYQIGEVMNPGTVPTMPALPTYTAPKWDEERIRALAGRIASPGLRNIRQQVQRASNASQVSSNPNVRAMTLREALSGYGSGLESIIAGARTGAGSEYAREYGTKESEAQANYEAKKQKLFAEYQAAYNDYMAKEARKPVYGGVSSGYGAPVGGYRRLSAPVAPKTSPTTVDLMGYIGGTDGGYEPSTFVPSEPVAQSQGYDWPKTDVSSFSNDPFFSSDDPSFWENYTQQYNDTYDDDYWKTYSDYSGDYSDY